MHACQCPRFHCVLTRALRYAGNPYQPRTRRARTPAQRQRQKVSSNSKSSSSQQEVASSKALSQCSSQQASPGMQQWSQQQQLGLCIPPQIQFWK